MRKNGFLTFCFSFIPGAGQMYQGYMKRGVSVMLIFISSIVIAVMTRVPIFGMLAPIVYAYAFFDTFNLRSSIIDNQINQSNLKEDGYIWKDFIEENIKEKNNNITNSKNKYIGALLLIIGTYILLINIMNLISRTTELEWLYRSIKRIIEYLPSVIISLISIGIGIRLILGKRK